MKPKIVIIGGGSGLPVIIRPLIKYDVDLSAIVTVADDGGSSGVLRNYINIVPPGDIRNILAAMADVDPEILRIFQYRFNSQDDFFAQHAVGNLLIAAMTEMYGNIFDAVQRLSSLLKIKGHIYPVANEPLVLNARFDDGQQLTGEAEITAAHKVIQEVWVTNEDSQRTVHASSDVVDAILEADMIVYGPGSLFTSILPNVVLPEVRQALQQTAAKQVYIANIMTQKGETDAYTDAQHLSALNRHIGQPVINYLLTNASPVSDDFVDYQKWTELSQQVVQDPIGVQKQGAISLSGDYLQLRDAGAFHDGKKVSAELMKILEL
ncbi:gluconeogenesis factor YvcK family protein [Convivina praedatoris]|uniref:Putative gluconeogenesis factor n=1 Tax=Convivina praedatoris TaxID=2880963 RepID=A0ABM9D3T2_9LACO|nr:uridine diphosphate-N-acetylglucosamine-binding protein YvcK [Convivina sp. LMG 32447]CAH1852594.1 Putative gluconeogenesis factor [Convivina sp. LMG 32447]CAH1852638.1 Putative gluconeogenesis factor [Convivina sp. LMG 32447]CAH1854945.1 Putative gluconeogenesis factor [Convivina sp. LMG 32447]